MVTATNVFEYTFLISSQLTPPTKHSQEIWDKEYVLVQSTEWYGYKGMLSLGEGTLKSL